MSEVKLFEAYVENRLQHWGSVFALHRDHENIGWREKSMLAVLLETGFQGQPEAKGYKPLQVDELAMQIEEIVHEISIPDSTRPYAQVLRAWYAARGRKHVEKLEEARSRLGRRICAKTFYRMHGLAFDIVFRRMKSMAQAVKKRAHESPGVRDGS